MIDLNMIKNIRMTYGNEAVNEEYKNRVVETLKKYNMPIDTFLNNLKDIRVLKTSDNSVAGDYLCSSNSITYSDEESYMHELMHAASNVNRKTNGIVLENNGNKVGTSLNEGITDLFACRAGNKHSNYPFEKYVAETIETLYGADIYISYFKNDGNKLYNERAELYLIVKALDEYTQGMYKLYDLMAKEQDKKTINSIVKQIDETREIFLEIFTTLNEYSTYLGNDKMKELLNNEDLENVMVLLNINKDVLSNAVCK